jgi:hypothetical protein
VALGMASVLVAGGASGPRSETVVRWARQLLAREQVQGHGLIGARAVDRAHPLYDSVVPGDPMQIVAERLTDDPAWAAALLGDRQVWDGLLSRPWDDDAGALSQLVARAGTAHGAAGREAVRSGLEALGAGLTAEGDPADWTVRQETAAAVARALGEGVAGHVSVATDVLQAGVEGGLSGRADDILRGLGYLTLDRDAAGAVETALLDWARVQPIALEGTGPDSSPPAVAVPAAYVAVQEYGQRLAHAIRGFQAQAAAEQAETEWNWTWGLLANLVLGRLGPLAGVAEGYGAIFAGADGTWENGIDHGLRFDREAAAGLVLAELGPDRVAAAPEAAGQASVAYDRTAEALGSPTPPTSPPTDWFEPLVDAAADVAVGTVADDGGKFLRDLVRRLEAAFGGRP